MGEIMAKADLLKPYLETTLMLYISGFASRTPSIWSPFTSHDLIISLSSTEALMHQDLELKNFIPIPHLLPVHEKTVQQYL